MGGQEKARPQFQTRYCHGKLSLALVESRLETPPPLYSFPRGLSQAVGVTGKLSDREFQL